MYHEAWICQQHGSRCSSWIADEFSEGVESVEEDGADMFLMALGVLCAIGDGIVMPVMLFVSNSIVNNIEDSSSSMLPMFS
ncbi:ABC transporter B family member 15-like protein [Tanacetum coccineum]